MTGVAWSKRLVMLLAVALLVAVTCVALGIWQIARLHQKQQFNAALVAGLAAPPAPLEELLAGDGDPDTLRYRRVEATGTYDVEHEFVLYGRTQESQAGNHLLTPLRLTDGGAVLVDRGWVPLDVDTPGAPIAAPPTGDIHVEGVLFASEGGAPGDVEPSDEDAGATTIAKLDLAAIRSQLPYPIAPNYVLLQDQSPAQPDGWPRPAPLPEPSDGPHLSYAVQWFTFAIIAVVGFVVLARRERVDPPSASSEQVG